jgi:TRAP-type mannitol/chloroaromatic compound transport system substrate-binding protein
MKRMPTIAALLAASAIAAPAAAETIVMQSIYPSSLPLLGESGKDVAERIRLLTDGEINIEFNEPGAIVAGGEIWDAVSTGAIDAGWYSPGFADTIIPSAAIFTAVPFGPDVREYTAWWYHGGGKELWAEITEPYNIHTELCTILVPEASGWFREPIESPDQLRGLKMRIFGLGAQVMQKLGAEAQSLPPADTMTALRLGTIDAAEFSFPLIDLQVGFPDFASHYYFPGWHQQTSLITLIVNRDRWNALSDRHRAIIEDACLAQVARTTARGEAEQLEALAEIEAQGVTIHRWNDEMMQAFRDAWEEVAAERSAADADFARALQSLQDFREQYRTWAELGYVD